MCACGVCSPTRTSAYVIVLNKRNRWMLYDVRVGEREKGESKKEREREGARVCESERRRGTKPCSHLLSLNFTMSVGLPL